VVSKRQIASESPRKVRDFASDLIYIKVLKRPQADEKAQHTLEYVSILKRFATQLSGARWGFETTSIDCGSESAILMFESTTTRKAGGLDFAAMGGKRQGREVPHSLRVKPGAKHPV
jgi:hypothetical protein